MKFSIFLPSGFAQEFAHVPSPVTAYERLVEVAKLADYAGYKRNTIRARPPNHHPTFTRNSVRGLVGLITGLARETSRVRLGHLVTANSYRNPALAAKMQSTVDVISHGRLVFGIGAGMVGTRLPAVRIRVRHRKIELLRKLDEATQIILGLWTQKETTFEGKHYRVHGAVNEPKGVQKPHIPLDGSPAAARR